MLETILWVTYAVMGSVMVANLLYLRHRASGQVPPDLLLSIMIPARNEARNLQRLLPTILSQRGVRLEVIVYDDESSDGTAEIALQVGDPRIRVLRGGRLPPGWVGKVHALYQASRHAEGDVYLFLDADTAFKDAGALARIVSTFAALGPGSVLTALPHFKGGGRLLVSGIPHALLVALPLPAMPLLKSRLVAALNGQMWMIQRQVYHRLEPHRAHAGEVLEDIHIGRYLAARGVIPYFANLQDDLAVWMYESLADAWRGFRKNAYLMMGGRPAPFALLMAWFTLTFVAAPLVSPWFLVPIYATKLAADRFARQPAWITLLAPIGFLLWWLLDLDSALSNEMGRVKWKGRRVAGKRAAPR